MDMDILIPAWVDGAITPVGKLDAHLRGLRHKAVSVFVIDGPRLLVQRRAAGKYHTPGLWANTCCTHPRWGESGPDCATRRLAEEMGIGGLALEARGILEYRAGVGGGMVEHEVVETFIARASADLSLAPDPSEVQATDWVDIDELTARTLRHPERFTPWLRIYLAEHRTGIFGAPA